MGMSVFFENIAGNGALKEQISRNIVDNTLSHAYIIEGPAGSGRHTLAYNIAAALSCTGNGSIPCGKCKSCSKILSFKSPDVITVSLEKDRVTMGVETIRGIKEDIVIAPNDLDRKVYIIENADTMTQQAQNAFLLSLEDPPEYVLFFLICESSANLLETVRSRAPIYRMKRLDESELREYLIKNSQQALGLYQNEPEVFETVIKVSDGRIGLALSLLDAEARSDMMEERKVAQKLLSLLIAPDRTAAMKAVASLGNSRQDIKKYLTDAQYATRDLIVLKKSDNAPMLFYTDRDAAQELSTRYSSYSLMKFYDALSAAVVDLEANANVRLTLMNMIEASGLI